MPAEPQLRVRTADYHTAGEPFRIVLDWPVPLAGRTILDKRRYAQANLDQIRLLLVNEPRGHADMYGCFVTEPEDEGADLGAVFFHNAGYSTACGHGTIALVTWALESGRLPGRGPQTPVVVDVPSGRLKTVASLEGSDVTSVSFRNVPAFVHSRRLRSAGRLVDVAYGGAFYAITPEPVRRDNLPALIALGRAIKHELEASHQFVHPLEPEIRGIYGVIFTEGDSNVTIFADGEVDRSPCGSGTSARLALLDATGELARGSELQHRGIVGTVFRARVVGAAEVAGIPAVITEVQGTAHRTGEHTFILEPGDDLGTGFLLR